MMECTNCGHEQASGKFCGKCGSVLEAQLAGAGQTSVPDTGSEKTASSPYTAAPSAAGASAYQQPAEPNQHVVKVKETSKQYWAYFLQYAKNPSSILAQSSANFTNSLITVAIFALIFALAVYKNLSLIIAPFEDFGSIFTDSSSMMPSFFSVLISSILTIGVIFLLSAVCIYAVNKFMGTNLPFKNIVTSFGTLLIPSMVLLLAAYLLLMIESIIIGNSLLVLAISYSIFVMPLFLITSLLTAKKQSVDAYYGFISYIVLFGIVLSITLSVLFDSTIGRYMEMFSEIL